MSIVAAPLAFWFRMLLTLIALPSAGFPVVIQCVTGVTAHLLLNSCFLLPTALIVLLVAVLVLLWARLLVAA